MMVVYAFQWFLLGLAPWCSIYFHITNFLCASDVTYFKKWQVAFFGGGQFRSVQSQNNWAFSQVPKTHRIHGAAIYGNMDTINIPPLC